MICIGIKIKILLQKNRETGKEKSGKEHFLRRRWNRISRLETIGRVIIRQRRWQNVQWCLSFGVDRVIAASIFALETTTSLGWKRWIMEARNSKEIEKEIPQENRGRETERERILTRKAPRGLNKRPEFIPGPQVRRRWTELRKAIIPTNESRH